MVYECAGQIEIEVPWDNVPDNIQIVWQGHFVVDECNPEQGGVALSWEKSAAGLVVNDGYIGYTPPSTFDLMVIDLKDCVAAPETIVEVVDYPVPGAPFEVCTSVDVTLEPS